MIRRELQYSPEGNCLQQVDSTGPRIAIIGAGWSGIAALRACVDEGLNVVCFEQGDSFGGCWRLMDNEHETQTPSTARKAHANTFSYVNKNLMQYSNFPFPSTTPLFPTHIEVMKYLRKCVEEGGLSSFIKTKRKVCKLRRTNDGFWSVSFASMVGNSFQKSEIFSHIIVATGQYAKQDVIRPGLDTRDFKGRLMLSSEYSTKKLFSEQTQCRDGLGILIVGSTPEALEIACDAAATQSLSPHQIPSHPIYLSFENWLYTTPMVVPGSDTGRQEPPTVPYDMQSWTEIRLAAHLLSDVTRRCVRMKSGILHSKQSVESVLVPSGHFETYLSQGRVIVKSSPIRDISHRGVVFEDGSHIPNLATILLANDYQADLSYFEDIPPKISQLIGGIWARDSECYDDRTLSTLAFVGFKKLNELNDYAVIELQARLVAQTLRAGRAISTCLTPVNIADRLTYEHWLAKCIGCFPSFSCVQQRLGIFTALNVWLGPALPSHYRIVGPYSSPDIAKDDIERVISTSEQSPLKFIKLFFPALRLIVICFIVYFFWRHCLPFKTLLQEPPQRRSVCDMLLHWVDK